jgi:hypothetical protein
MCRLLRPAPSIETPRGELTSVPTVPRRTSSRPTASLRPPHAAQRPPAEVDLPLPLPSSVDRPSLAGQIQAAEIAVGTRIAPRPPHSVPFQTGTTSSADSARIRSRITHSDRIRSLVHVPNIADLSPAVGLCADPEAQPPPPYARLDRGRKEPIVQARLHLGGQDAARFATNEPTKGVGPSTRGTPRSTHKVPKTPIDGTGVSY